MSRYDGEAVVAQMRANLRRRILRAVFGRGLIESCDAKAMPAYQHRGFSVGASVRIEAQDRAGLERLLRYCARPPFAMDGLRKEGAARVYRCAKQHSESASCKRGGKAVRPPMRHNLRIVLDPPQLLGGHRPQLLAHVEQRLGIPAVWISPAGQEAYLGCYKISTAFPARRCPATSPRPLCVRDHRSRGTRPRPRSPKLPDS
jgi:Putative transposase